MHGFSKNRSFWYSWISGLAARYRVIRLDQRGHGDSSPLPPGFQMALRPFSEDLVQFLDALRIERAHFVMAEFTSAVAVDFAATFPDRIRSLTLPGFGYNYRNSTVDRSEWVRLAEQEGAAAWARATNRYRLPLDANSAMREWYINEQARMPGWVLGGLFRFNANLDLTDRLHEMSVPTLIIAGTEARQGTIEDAQLAAKLIPACRLAVLDGMPFNVMSAAPERCVAETLRFLDDLHAGRPINGDV
ncbi:MAG: alpha/beta fold hydrolase [Steroidobacteraceae bacterium]